MPIFSYICKDCNNKFDLLEGVTQEKVKKACPKCSSVKIEKTFAAFGVGKSDRSGPPCGIPDAGGSCSSCCPGGSCPMM
jgi:putative FmdB family regulatory protein